MTTTHKDPRAVIEQLVEALEVLKNLDADINFLNTNKWEGMVEAAITAGREALKLRTCTWTQHDDVHMPGTYETECGELWSFVEGGPSDNKTKFCHGCGGLVYEPEGINGLTEAETSASMSVLGLSKPTASEPAIPAKTISQIRHGNDLYISTDEPMTPEEYAHLTANGAKAWSGVDAQALRDSVAPSTAGEVAKTCCGQDEFCPTCEPATFAVQPAQGERTVTDRSDSVNLARNVMERKRYLPKAVTPHGVEMLCDSVLRMDAALLQSTPDARPVQRPYEHVMNACHGITVDPVTGNVGVGTPPVSQPAPSTDLCLNCVGYGWEPHVYKGRVPCSFCKPESD